MTQMGQPDETLQTAEIAIIEEPKKGTLPWLAAQTHVDWEGLSVPDVNRIPPGSERYTGEDDGKCRVVMPERGRCRAPRVRTYGICSAHLGGGDPGAGADAATASRVKLKERRMLLGIGPGRVGNPRQHARLAALARADELAKALVDGPLDDVELGSVERQQAVIRMLDSTFPLQSMTVEVELPADAAGVAAMGWEEMQRLAATYAETDTAPIQAIETQ
jgi:hypothetical protein